MINVLRNDFGRYKYGTLNTKESFDKSQVKSTIGGLL